MSIVMQINPFDFFVDSGGDALDAGYIWIGQTNLDPRQYPIVTYYDAALTIPAAQPLRTSNGYVVRNGSPTFLYVSGNYSVRVEDSRHRQVFYVPDFLLIGNNSAVSLGDITNATDPTKGAGMVGFTQDGAGAIPRNVRAKLVEDVSITDFGGAVGPFDSGPALILADAATTGTVIVPGGNFTVTATTANSGSIFAALSRIRIDGNLTVNIDSGVHNLSAAVRIFSPEVNVGGLQVLGAAVVPITITGQVGTSGGSGSYSVTLSVLSAGGVVSGDFLHVWDVTGTGCPEVHRGMWEITGVNIGAGQITVRNTCRTAVFPTNTITASSSSALKSVLKFNNCDGFVAIGGRLDFLDRVAIVGNSDTYWSSAAVTATEKGTHGILVGSVTIALNGKTDNPNPNGVSSGHISCGQNVGVNGFDQQGVLTELGGTFYGDFVSACNNKRRGFYASTSSGIRAKHISANGNFLDGVISDLGGDVYASSQSCAVANGQRGISASQNGSIIYDTGIISQNGTDGIGAVLGGMVQATTAKMEDNGFSGCLGEYGGVLVINNSSMARNGRHGIIASFGATARASNSNINNNTQFGINAQENSVVICSGTSFSANGSGDKTIRGGAVILDGSTYTLSTVSGTDLRAIGGTLGQGVRIASTSGGDDLIMGHDTTGGGTFTNSFHARSGTGGFYPQTDNNVPLGRASERWSVVFAGNGTINTSDAREKTPVRSLDEMELKAGSRLARAIGVFQWLNSIEHKGEDLARLHVGMTVQRAIQIMQEEGLDPFRYGLICFDEWSEQREWLPAVYRETGEFDSGGSPIMELVEEAREVVSREAGQIYGFREGALHNLMLRGVAYENDQIMARLDALEGGAQ